MPRDKTAILVCIGCAPLYRRDNDDLAFLVELIQNAPITNPSAERSGKAFQKFHVAVERVFAHSRKCVID
jgi:hypothetical protein